MEDRVKTVTEQTNDLVKRLQDAGVLKDPKVGVNLQDVHHGFMDYEQSRDRIHRADPFLGRPVIHHIDPAGFDHTSLSQYGSKIRNSEEDADAEFRKQLNDAVRYGTSTAKTVRVKGPADFSDAEMVMDMIRRGYAVMKLPADGGPPEALRGPTNSK